MEAGVSKDEAMCDQRLPHRALPAQPKTAVRVWTIRSIWSLAMIRPLLLSCLLASLAFANARANPSLVDKAFGNTIVSTYPDGRTGHLWLKADGSYTAQGRKQDPSRGHWRVKGNRLCLSQVRPVPSPFSYCTPIPSNGMDKQWAAKAVTGERITVRLVHGREGAQTGA
jgi:hypothetical protein